MEISTGREGRRSPSNDGNSSCPSVAVPCIPTVLSSMFDPSTADSPTAQLDATHANAVLKHSWVALLRHISSASQPSTTRLGQSTQPIAALWPRTPERIAVIAEVSCPAAASCMLHVMDKFLALDPRTAALPAHPFRASALRFH